MKPHLKQKLMELASDYARQWQEAKTSSTDHRLAGIQAQNRWIQEDIPRRCPGCRVIANPRTGLNGRGSGGSSFDARLIIDGCEVFVEVQSSNYGGNRKGVQLQGQLLGFTEVFVPIGRPMLFARIIAWPRIVEIWDLTETQKALEQGDYASQQTFAF